ncbi:hypothetical protein KBP46_07495 [Chryseobacterium sp. PCH239]|uniref:hypothetical protein n=1 Tax=Chryseobacterium sp. PCH239 TaxID=2825845 RepID=UPI001C1278F6|nr:hypothetical protein [Chryseobacterium sp. PCH239]QWT87678.1 hypothetical protein KBP46_07495 [Chryseobacterium sp. PCH239]
MKKIIAASLIICGYALGYSQSVEAKESKYNLTIKSPDASQLSKHTDIPTSTHTGTVGIDIPIYTIKVGDFTLPISLKYHASGVKVKETASKVGLGWSLSVGGISLSKQVLGREDKGKIQYINPDSFNPVQSNLHDYNLAKSIKEEFSQLDTQPDIYSFSLGNVSGEFYYDSSGKIIQIPFSTVKIEDAFVFTDDQGIKYFFKVGNQTQTVGGGTPAPHDFSNTDFIITRILLPTGKEIKFNYQASSYSYLNNFYKGLKIPRACVYQNGITYEEFVTKTNVLSESVLQSIEFEGGEVKFIYGNREDINNGLSLNKIEVRNPQQTLISDYSLVKDYFTSTDSPSAPGYDSEIPYLMKRLKLKEVVNLKDNSKYKLQYYENNPLPNRLSDQTDFVGFYNGKLANHGIPFVAYGDKIYGFGDDKNPDINYAVSGSLKEIQYPTGGKMGLQYELDDFYFKGTETQIGKKHFLISNLEPLGGIFNVNTNGNTVDFRITFQSTANPDEGPIGSLPEGPHFVGELLDNANTVLRTFLINKEYEFVENIKPSYKIRIRKVGNVSSSHYATLNAQWYEKVSEVKQYNKSVGGIRIQKITKNDADQLTHETEFIYRDENNKSTGRYMADDIEYSYIQEVAEDQEFGYTCEQMVISNSGNFNISTINGKPTIYDKVITRNKNINNNTESYEITDEYMNLSHTNPKNARSPIFTYANNQFARGILTDRKYYNSQHKLIKKDSYTYEFDNHFNNLSNDYSTGFPSLTIRPYYIGVKSMACAVHDANGVCLGRNYTFTVDRYEISSAWVKKKMITTTDYFNNSEISQITSYTYDDNYRHTNPTIVNVDFSDASQLTQFEYAHEKSNQLMISKNMIGIPLETISSKTVGNTSKILSQTKTLYPFNQSEADLKTSGLVLPYTILSTDLQNVVSTEVTYDKYDNKGNLQQYTTKDGISTVIIWGYNQTQPIAKIEGAKLTDIQQSLIDSIVNASNTDALAGPNNDETSFLSALNTFRANKALSAYQITTFTYDPLVGVRSITPPSGIRESYVYDSANRLQKVIDVNGKVLKEMKYNYKN